ncbi:MAG: hypothetical protein KIC73_04965 [Clostridiales bacterium]|nr:hypothetical protein [Clostridiales bacterium]
MKQKKRIFIIIPVILFFLVLGYSITAQKLKAPKTELETKAEESTMVTRENREPESIPDSDTQESSKEADFTPENFDEVNMVISDQNSSIFKGKAGKQDIFLAIFRNGDDLTASLITSGDDNTETHLTGTIQLNDPAFTSKANRSTYTLKNEDDSIIFYGLIIPGTEEGDLLTGIYKNKKDRIEADVKLVLSYSFASTPEARYPLMEASTKEIENFAKEIKSYVISDNKKELAQLIHYPINVTIHNEKKTINSPEELIQSYDDIITADFKDKIKNSQTTYLFSNDLGVMMGDGDIWFNSLEGKGLKIIAINN